MRHPIMQKLAGGLCFAVLTAAMLALCNFLLTDNIHSYSRVMLQELYSQDGSIDTLFVGSSHCYRSVDPDKINEQLGLHSFNAGTSQQLPDGAYYLLREAASRNELKTVYVEMFYTTYNNERSSQVPLACYLITDYLDPLSPNRYQYLWEMGGPAAFVDLLLPARHAIADPGEIPGLLKAKLTDGYQPGNYRYVTYPEEGEEYRGNGFVYTFGIPYYGFDSILPVNDEQPISDFGWEYLRRIADFCEGNGIRLILFTSPLPSAYAANTENYQAYVDALREFCDQRGSQYWDFTLYRQAFVGFEDYADAHHLNGQGAEKFTEVLCGVMAADAAGENTQDLFFDTLEEKLACAPDDTLGR